MPDLRATELAQTSVEPALWRIDGGQQVSAVVTLLRNPEVTASHVFVLVHGLGMGRDYFDSFAKTMTGLGPVVMIDLPGFGDSKDPHRALSVTELAQVTGDIVKLIAPLAHTVLVGHSMGTQIVAKVAAQLPACAGVVLIAPTIDSEHRSVSAQIWRFCLDLWHESPIVLLRGGWEYLHAGIQRILGTLRSMLRDDIEGTVARIVGPVLVLRGEHDPVCPRAWCQQVANSASRSSYAEIPGQGHAVMVHDSTDATDYIRTWLKQESV